jgi:hypothetical protein
MGRLEDKSLEELYYYLKDEKGTEKKVKYEVVLWKSNTYLNDKWVVTGRTGDMAYSEVISVEFKTRDEAETYKAGLVTRSLQGVQEEVDHR